VLITVKLDCILIMVIILGLIYMDGSKETSISLLLFILYF